MSQLFNALLHFKNSNSAKRAELNTDTLHHTITIDNMIHIGNIIKKQFDAQEGSVSWFAKQLCCDRTNDYSIFKRESIDTALLEKISIILKHDFFKYYSKDININDK